MINKIQALKIVKKIISEFSGPENDEYIILDKETIEKDWGWVFFHTSKKWHETQDLKYAVAGNAPYIVLRENGNAITTGTAHETEYYIKRFEETGDPHG